MTDKEAMQVALAALTVIYDASDGAVCPDKLFEAGVLGAMQALEESLKRTEKPEVLNAN